MKTKVLKAVGEYAMLTRGDCVIAAVSGGADSIAMLHCLLQLREQLGISLRACHVNHCLRGEESMRDEAFVRRICREWGIPLSVFRLSLERQRLAGESVETAARRCRYACLERCAGRFGGRIATAHTLSDSMETLFYNLMRGTGIKGLGGIPPVRGRIIRPLCLCTRAQVERYCGENSLSYVTDSTNLQDIYARNRIRHQLMPVVARLAPHSEKTIPRLMQTAREDSEYLEEMARQALQSSRMPGGICARRLQEMPAALRRRCAALLLQENGFTVSFERTQEVLQMLSAEHGRLEYAPGRYLSLRDGRVFCEERIEPEPAFCEPVRFSQGRAVVFAAGKRLEIQKVNYEFFKNLEKDSWMDLKNILDYDRITGTMQVRQRQAGDTIALAGRNGTKSLKKLFHEAGLSLAQRSRRLVLCDSEGPVWLEGFGVSRRAALKEPPRVCLLVRVLKAHSDNENGI